MIGLLARLFAEEPPDLRPARDALAPPAVAVRRRRGAPGHRLARLAELPPLPARALRRVRPALGRPGGRRLRPRRAPRFEQLGVGALLINCIPPDHVAGMVSYLRDFTDLPLGVYPNLGYLTDDGWRSAPGRRRRRSTPSSPPAGARRARRSSAAAAARARRTSRRRASGSREHARRARRARAPAVPDAERRDAGRARGRAGPTAATARSTRSRSRTSSASPASPSRAPSRFMVWEHLFADAVGAHQRCLDVGCGTGIQAVQLARNGATHVRALDVDPRAVANTLDERVPQRRRRPRHRERRRPLPVGARGALRGDRREPVRGSRSTPSGR